MRTAAWSWIAMRTARSTSTSGSLRGFRHTLSKSAVCCMTCLCRSFHKESVQAGRVVIKCGNILCRAEFMDKLQQFVTGELDALREKGVFNRPRVLETEQKATVVIDGHEVITLSSNNYLGLTVHPRLREAAIVAIKKYGVGSGSVRTIAGTMSLHVELEEKLARFKHTEASLTFQSGYATNLGVISALMLP